MNCYLDTSVILRVVLGQSPLLKQWKRWKNAYTSELAQVEARRVIDRLRLGGDIDDEQRATVHQDLVAIESALHIVGLDKRVLMGASEPLPTAVGTLDALHLTTARMLKEQHVEDLLFATHDTRQSTAARAMGLETTGA